MRPVVVHVRLASDSLLKITWAYDRTAFPHYFIDRQTLEARASEVRTLLKALIDTAMDQTGSLDVCGPPLRALAESGTLLRQALFSKAEGEGDPHRIEKWLLDDETPIESLDFVVDRRIHVPWGLMHDSDKVALKANESKIDIENYSGFWCLKYRVAAMYYRITPEGLTKVLKGEDVELISILNRGVYDTAREELVEDAVTGTSESNAIDNVLTYGGSAVTETRAFHRRWKQGIGRPVILYFYCHANATTLALSDSDKLTADDLKDSLTSHGMNQLPMSIAILNGCSTAEGSHDGGFLEATGSEKSCGFIGTEARVPYLFALRFGTELLRQILTSGNSVAEIMSAMRRSHWPLSLLYSVNCYPDLRISPEEVQIVPPRIGHGNYSQQRLGSRSLGVRSFPKR